MKDLVVSKFLLKNFSILLERKKLKLVPSLESSRDKIPASEYFQVVKANRKGQGDGTTWGSSGAQPLRVAGPPNPKLRSLNQGLISQ